MIYRLGIVPGAERQFKKLPHQIQNRVRPKLLSLGKEPRPFGSQKLRDTDYYRVRVGDYRIIYAVNDSEKGITILDIGHRRDVYR